MKAKSFWQKMRKLTYGGLLGLMLALVFGTFLQSSNVAHSQSNCPSDPGEKLCVQTASMATLGGCEYVDKRPSEKPIDNRADYCNVKYSESSCYDDCVCLCETRSFWGVSEGFKGNCNMVGTFMHTGAIIVDADGNHTSRRMIGWGKRYNSCRITLTGGGSKSSLLDTCETTCNGLPGGQEPITAVQLWCRCPAISPDEIPIKPYELNVQMDCSDLSDEALAEANRDTYMYNYLVISCPAQVLGIKYIAIRLFSTLIVLAGLVFLFLIVKASIMKMVSGDNQEQQAKANKALKGAMLGIVGVLAAYGILVFVGIWMGIGDRSKGAIYTYLDAGKIIFDFTVPGADEYPIY